jgi:hypothetical protein
MARLMTATIAALVLLPGAAAAQMAHSHDGRQTCDEPALRCATKVTPAFAPEGALWLAWAAGGRSDPVFGLTASVYCHKKSGDLNSLSRRNP